MRLLLCNKWGSCQIQEFATKQKNILKHNNKFSILYWLVDLFEFILALGEEMHYLMYYHNYLTNLKLSCMRNFDLI